MPLTLNTATSIADFLKSKNLPGDYSSRQKIYNELGFSDRLGAFVGSANQNTALLKNLSTDTSQLDKVYSLFDKQSLGAGVPGYPGVKEGDVVPGKGILLPDGTFSGEQQNNSQVPISPIVPSTEPPKLPTADQLGIPKIPSVQDIVGQQKPFSIEDFMNTAGAKLQMDTFNAEKQNIDAVEAQKEKQTVESFGSRGLFFSGMREGGVRDLQQAALADKLGVDRKIAGYMIDATEEAQKASMVAVEKLVKEAKDNRKDAIDRLEKIGYTVLPDGTVAPTLENQKMQAKDEQQQITNELNQLKFELSQTKSQQQADAVLARIQIAEGNLKVAEARLAIAQGNGGETKGEKRDALVSQILESGKGTDGFVDAATYRSALRKFIANGGTQANFVASFPQQTYLRQQEIEKLPAALQTAQVTPVKNLAPQQISYINDAKAELDAWKQSHPFQDFSQARQFLIDQIKQQYNFDVNPYL